MPPEAIAAALLSALIHAAWNAALKAGKDRLIDVGVMGLGGIAFGLAMLAWRGVPDAAAWPYLAASSVVHVLYWVALNRGYAAGDMSHVYTIARGIAPALVGLGAAVIAREWPSGMAAAGIVLVSGGIAAIGLSPRASISATTWAAATGVSIATYSLIDALGARASGDAMAYIGISSLGTFVPIALYCFLRRSADSVRANMSGRWLQVLAAGALSNAGFGLALWAQTIAPIAYVTALRETSVVFGTAIAAWLLREAVTPRRWLGAAVVALGAGLIGFSRD
jgi:drug/metabolite transporter (DMT)-like permease